MDISKLIHIADFNFDSAALGGIRCGPFGDELAKFDKMARENFKGEVLARDLILSIGHKLTGNPDVDSVAGGPSLKPDEVALLSKAELDNFCDQFVARRLRHGIDAQDSEKKGGVSRESVKTGCEGLGSAIVAHTDSQRAQRERILGQARNSILGGVAAEAMRKSLQENSIADQFKKFALGDSIAEQARKFKLGGLMEQMQRDALGVSAVEAAYRTVRASDNLGETIAALRASDAAAKIIATPFESPMTTFKLPQILPNPILETNNLLRKQHVYAEEMRPTIIRSAELIQTLTDTTLATQALANDNSAQAERHARKSMWVAIFSIIIAVITGGFSIYYAKVSPSAEQLDLLAKDLGGQLSAVTDLAQADRIAYEKKAAEDRAILTKAISQQSELIRELRTASGKLAQSSGKRPQRRPQRGQF